MQLYWRIAVIRATAPPPATRSTTRAGSEALVYERAPELVAVRERLRSWRFYDHFRTDPLAPARSPQIGTRTVALGHDGSDVAAALQTIREMGDVRALDETIDHAFPGNILSLSSSSGLFELALKQPGMLRSLSVAELSDGTLRYLLLVAALLTPRPPALMVLNEPETSLHPSMLEPLAALIVRAAKSTQVVVVSHARGLIDGIERTAAGLKLAELTKELGETKIVGQEVLDEPPWNWPER